MSRSARRNTAVSSASSVASAPQSSMPSMPAPPSAEDDVHMNALFKTARRVHGDGQEAARKDMYAAISELLRSRVAWGMEEGEPATLARFLAHRADVMHKYRHRRERWQQVLAKLFSWAEDALVGAARGDAGAVCDAESAPRRAGSAQGSEGASTARHLNEEAVVEVTVPRGCTSIRIVLK